MNARDALREAETRLAAAGVDTPRVDAELLVAHLLGVSRTQLFADLDREVDGLEPLLARREAREPLAYVLGEWGFRRLTLKTDARATRAAARDGDRRRALRSRCSTASTVPRVLDVGVGSGAIALAIKDERPDAQVTGVDESLDALALARENAELLGLDVDLREGGVETAGDGWELVVSNPPYVESLDGLQPELRWEPEGALVGSGFHERLAEASRTHALVVEAGDGQAGRVAAALAVVRLPKRDDHARSGRD